MNDFSKGHPDDIANGKVDKRDEKFHESIKGSAKISVPGIEYPIQYVFVQGLNSNGTVEEQLEEITDLPACVSYKVVNGEKKFIIPEKGKEALMTRIIPSSDICPSRREKYEKRGYHFI